MNRFLMIIIVTVRTLKLLAHTGLFIMNAQKVLLLKLARKLLLTHDMLQNSDMIGTFGYLAFKLNNKNQSEKIMRFSFEFSPICENRIFFPNTSVFTNIFFGSFSKPNIQMSQSYQNFATCPGSQEAFWPI